MKKTHPSISDDQTICSNELYDVKNDQTISVKNIVKASTVSMGIVSLYICRDHPILYLSTMPDFHDMLMWQMDEFKKLGCSVVVVGGGTEEGAKYSVKK